MGTETLAAAGVSASSKVEVFLLVVFYAVLGYIYAVYTRRAKGTTPWHIPALAWALFSGLTPPFGFVLEIIARFTTRSVWTHEEPRPFYRSSQMSGFPGLDAPPANPAGGTAPWPTELELRPGPGGWVPGPDSGAPPIFGWYPDPDGHHELRYWDGRRWGDWVRDGEVTGVEPLSRAAQTPWSFGGSAPAEAPPAGWL